MHSPVRPDREIIATMTDGTVGFLKEDDLVELIIASGVAKAVERFGIVSVRIEGPAVKDEPATFFEVFVDDFRLLDFLSWASGGEAEDSLVLHADVKAILFVDRKTDP